MLVSGMLFGNVSIHTVLFVEGAVLFENRIFTANVNLKINVY